MPQRMSFANHRASIFGLDLAIPVPKEHSLIFSFYSLAYEISKVAPVTLVVSPLFSQVICNSFTICNAEMQEVGVGLYPRYGKHYFINWKK